jgi:BASS family bile acid:Na+ symporter
LPVLVQVRFTTYAAMFVSVLAATVLGAWAAGAWREDRRTLGVAVAQGNPGLGLAVIAASHPGFKPAAIVVAYVLVRAVAMVPFKVWSRRARRYPGGAAEVASV